MILLRATNLENPKPEPVHIGSVTVSKSGYHRRVETHPRFKWRKNEGVWVKVSGTVVSIVIGLLLTTLTTVYYRVDNGVYPQ